MADPQALEIEASMARRRLVESAVAAGEAANPSGFYNEWDAAVGKSSGRVFSKNDILPENVNGVPEEYTFVVPGDHLFYRGAFGIELAEHHGLYIGGGWVVEAWVNSSVEGFRRALVTPEIHAGMVDARSLAEFNDGGAKVVFIREYIPPRTADERREAVRRAIESFGTRGYNLMRANCEHFVCEVVVGPDRKEGAPGFFGQLKGAAGGVPGTGYVPHSGQIDRFVDKPIVLGKICEEYVKDIISKRDALVYISDAEMYLKYVKQPSLSATELGNIRSMALRYGYASTADGTPVRSADSKALLELLRPAMLINMARAAPQISGAVSTALNQMHMTSGPTDGDRPHKRQRS